MEYRGRRTLVRVICPGLGSWRSAAECRNCAITRGCGVYPHQTRHCGLKGLRAECLTERRWEQCGGEGKFGSKAPGARRASASRSRIGTNRRETALAAGRRDRVVSEPRRTKNLTLGTRSRLAISQRALG